MRENSFVSSLFPPSSVARKFCIVLDLKYDTFLHIFLGLYGFHISSYMSLHGTISLS